jgi:hypothetical protein
MPRTSNFLHPKNESHDDYASYSNFSNDYYPVIRKIRKTAYLQKSPLNPQKGKPHQDIQKPIAVEYKSNIIEQIKAISKS